ncbi:sugar O-acetyltransferase [Flavobacterium sp.]|uniref:sugar O-acetyltransferase n=1 Tax=Flavobacterium sp. TaxID=239 RepID=UPI00286F123D|nr:sugar O-acetyltransferase [Flavobacterium sp.]
MKPEKEKIMDGKPYPLGDLDLKKDRRKAKNLLHRLNVTEYRMTRNARLILEELLPNAGSNLYIEPPFFCDYGYNILCGDNVFFNVNCVVLDENKVTIGSNVLLGPGVQLYTASHPLEAQMRRTHKISKPISIGDDCWIGGSAIICPGVTIGNGCVIGAGAVVTKDIPDYSMALGNPAKVIKKLE